MYILVRCASDMHIPFDRQRARDVPSGICKNFLVAGDLVIVFNANVIIEIHTSLVDGVQVRIGDGLLKLESPTERPMLKQDPSAIWQSTADRGDVPARLVLSPPLAHPPRHEPPQTPALFGPSPTPASPGAQGILELRGPKRVSGPWGTRPLMVMRLG